MNDENEQECICYRKQDFQLVCCILNSGKDSNWFIGRVFFMEGVFYLGEYRFCYPSSLVPLLFQSFYSSEKKNKKDFHGNRAQLEVYSHHQVFHTNTKNLTGLKKCLYWKTRVSI